MRMKSFVNKRTTSTRISPVKKILRLTTSQMLSRDLEMKPLVPKIDLNRLGPLVITIQTIRFAITQEFKVTITVHQLRVETAAHIDKIQEILRTMATFSILMVELNSQASQGRLLIIVHHKTPKVNQA